MNALTSVSQQISELLAAFSLDILVIVSVAAVLSLLLWRAAPRYRYLLWLLVLGRLLVPVHLELPSGVVPYRTALPAAASSLPADRAAALEQPGDTRPAAAVQEQQPRLPVPGQEPAPAAVAASPSRQPAAQAVQLDVEPVASSLPVTTASSGVDLPAILWLAGVLALAVVVVCRTLRVHRMLRSCRIVQRPELAALVRTISARLRLRQRVRVLSAADDLGLPLPGVLGVLRPVVVLPESMARDWPLDELESLLVHELAHVRRLDPLVNGVQTWLQVLLFFHPLVWFLSWRLRCERELACDDEVVAYYRGRPLPYLRSLLRCAQVRCALPRLRLATVGLAEPTSTLERRMRRLRNRRFTLLSAGRRVLSLTAVLLLAGISFALAARPAPQLQLSGLVVSEAPVEAIELRVWERGHDLFDAPQRLRQPLCEEQIEPGRPFSVALTPDDLPVIVEVTAAGHVAAAFDVVLPEQAGLPSLFLRRGRGVQVVVEQGGKPVAEALINASIHCEQSRLVSRYPGRWQREEQRYSAASVR